MAEQVPLLEQYNRIKALHKDEILFFRLGDFYEMFYGDAVEASALLNLTLTHRQEAPMCGVPHHAARAYVARLLRAGKKVAICEQLAAPGKGKGIIERGVVEVVTPGSVVDDDYLESGANNYLVAFGAFGDSMALAWADASTGEFRAVSFPRADVERLRRELYRLSPREAIVRESVLDDDTVARVLAENPGIMLNRYPDWTFSVEQGRAVLLKHFGTKSLKGFGFDDDAPSIAAAGALLEYLKDSVKVEPTQFRTLRGSEDSEHVAIDESSQKNLEIVRNLRDGGVAFSLLGVVDHTRTAMGTRALRQRLQQPLRSASAINGRLDAVEALYRDQRALERIRAALGSCRDLERLTSRLAMDKANPKDLVALRDTISAALTLDSALPAGAPSGLSVLAVAARRDAAVAFVGTLTRAIAEDPALTPADGSVIKAGWNAELDALRALRADAHGVLEAYLEEERAATGLSGLRVKYNKIIGYYLELSKGAAQGAPAHFMRRQTIASGERYTTERLGALESEINGAAERIVDLERVLFAEFRSGLRAYAPELFETARELADLDCAASFAWAATVHGYTRPVVDESIVLNVEGGRHPVVEAYLPSGDFVPNDLELDGNGTGFALITGPNMAGKSTFLRQNALIVLLAQAGSFVPAQSARIGVVDRIFCRVGAQDNLARGESTFLLEMHETASILNNAGPLSLVIMDEVGRGTGTLDGLSIAWAVSEHVLDECGSRTLFATHYHELTALRHDRLVDLSMAVEERAGEVVFLKRVAKGAATGSYGIHVARLAGVPLSVVARAEQIRDALEADEARLFVEAGDHDTDTVDSVASTEDGPGASARAVRRIPVPVRGTSGSTNRAPEPGGLFSVEELVLDELRSLDIDRMTPLDALSRLAAVKKALSAR
ncbi:MAG: DNA mismatch repair protein MutS [Spirochaetes bacterium GWB1_59_5]|nr:MAG: DNA mismatch repair protein MutS [Spirochaetes bacterium GWB1_59_5]